MHLSHNCLSILVFVLSFVLSSSVAQSQGSIRDDLSKIEDQRPRNKSKSLAPKYDEEFSAGEITNEVTEEEKLEQEVELSRQEENRETLPQQENRNELSNSKESLENTEIFNNTNKVNSDPSINEEDSLYEDNFFGEEELNVESQPLQDSLQNQKASEDKNTQTPLSEEAISNQENNLEENLEDTLNNEPEESITETFEDDLTPQEESQVQSEDSSWESEESYAEDIKEEDIYTEEVVVKKPRFYSREELERISKETNVQVEEEDYVSGTSLESRSSFFKSFKERRPKWTTQFELAYSFFEPLNYTSPFFSELYEERYDVPSVPLSGFTFEFKRNFNFGAIGFGVGASYFQSETFDQIADLTILAPSLKATLYLDNLFKEPYVVPYISFGYTYFSYTENFDDGITIDEEVSATDNFFIAFGGQFQLDWLDKSADESSYNMGLENTFIFVEGKLFLDRGILREEFDPDFSTGVFMSAGLKLEF